MTRALYDALVPDNIPAGAQCVAYYVDQITPAEAAVRWPEATLVSIARTALEDALVGDLETGDLTIADVVAWVQGQRSRGVAHPWVYCSTSPWPAVQAAFTAAGVSQPLYWIACPGVLQLLPGTVATQCIYAGPYDQSALADYVPGLDAPGRPSQEFTMPRFVSAGSGAPTYFQDGSLVFEVTDATDVAAVATEPVPQHTVTPAYIAAMLGAVGRAAPPATAAGPFDLALTGSLTPKTSG